jgi:hypothetical protein
VRGIGSNSQRGVLWLLGLQRLIAGTDASEVSIKASSFDDPLTATAWFPVECSTRGCANIRSVKSDKDGVFVQTSKIGAFRLAIDQTGFDYTASDLMAMHEKICDGSDIVDVAVQRRPDTIIWFILANGEARALTYEPAERVIGWSRIVTDGDFKRVACCRGGGQDSVFFAVERNATLRLEKMAMLTECQGGTTNCLADGFSRFTATLGQTTFSVPQLDSLDVTVWKNGVALHDQSNLYTVADSEVVLDACTAGDAIVIGLPYVGKWQSTQLAYGGPAGTALFRMKRVSQLGIYLVNTMLDGLRVGYDFDHLRKFTTTKEDKAIPAGHLYDAFDADLMSISSDWNTDSRICLEAKAPYPFTAAAIVMDQVTN